MSANAFIPAFFFGKENYLFFFSDDSEASFAA